MRIAVNQTVHLETKHSDIDAEISNVLAETERRMLFERNAVSYGHVSPQGPSVQLGGPDSGEAWHE